MLLLLSSGGPSGRTPGPGVVERAGRGAESRMGWQAGRRKEQKILASPKWKPEVAPGVCRQLEVGRLGVKTNRREGVCTSTQDLGSSHFRCRSLESQCSLKHQDIGNTLLAPRL